MVELILWIMQSHYALIVIEKNITDDGCFSKYI